MDREIQQRLHWVKLHLECGDSGLVCRYCGISSPTLRKWNNRNESNGLAGLKCPARRLHASPKSKLTPYIEKLIFNETLGPEDRSKNKHAIKTFISAQQPHIRRSRPIRYLDRHISLEERFPAL